MSTRLIDRFAILLHFNFLLVSSRAESVEERRAATTCAAISQHAGSAIFTGPDRSLKHPLPPAAVQRKN
jgi:hypothetical protein